MAERPTPAPANRLLAALSKADLDLLRPDLEPMSLALRAVLEEPNKAIRHVYFVDTGFASVVATIGGDRDIEVGIIGSEGVSGAAVILGNGRSPYSTYIQVAGEARRIPVAKLRSAMAQSSSLHGLLLKWAQAFSIQTAHTAVANARATVEQRLARWLLMAHDRVVGDEVVLTHEFLSLMLGVRRAGVTVAVHAFERQNLIQSARGRITILDRAGIEEIAGDFYGVPESEWNRLIGEARA
jgi:CRP-like cAMP-binding protein